MVAQRDHGTVPQRVSGGMTQPQSPVPADDPDGVAQPPAGSGLHPADPVDGAPAGESDPVGADADADADAGGGFDAGEWDGEADGGADAGESGAFAGPPPDVDVLRPAERGREADAARADTSDSAPTPTETPREAPAARPGMP
ncbi:MAG: hypothetical protein QOK35_1942 [Pseudonocardiales bacterium]|jgi:hypothetical protein|nr:hypothetical protein [Pseudonocardiales bacterium]